LHASTGRQPSYDDVITTLTTMNKKKKEKYNKATAKADAEADRQSH